MQHYTPVQIRFNDIDVLGHLNNTIYMQFFDIGKMHLFQECLDGILYWKELTPVLVHMEVDFISPVFIESKIRVNSYIVGFGNKSFSMVQEIENTTTGDIHCRAKSVLVAFNPKANEGVAVPERWKEKLTAFMK